MNMFTQQQKDFTVYQFIFVWS